MKLGLIIAALVSSTCSIANASDQALRDTIKETLLFEGLKADPTDKSLFVELWSGPNIEENNSKTPKRARRYIKFNNPGERIYYETGLFLANCETYEIGFRNYRQATIKNQTSITETSFPAPEKISLDPSYPKDASYLYTLFHNTCSDYFSLKDHYK